MPWGGSQIFSILKGSGGGFAGKVYTSTFKFGSLLRLSTTTAGIPTENPKEFGAM